MKSEITKKTRIILKYIAPKDFGRQGCTIWARELSEPIPVPIGFMLLTAKDLGKRTKTFSFIWRNAIPGKAYEFYWSEHNDDANVKWDDSETTRTNRVVLRVPFSINEDK